VSVGARFASRVAALYDIHANLPALEAVLRDIRSAQVDEIVVGGDVLPGPMPRETLEQLLNLDVPVNFICGNGDREALAVIRGTEPVTVPEPFREIVRWTARQLSTEHERLLASWPTTLRKQVRGLDEVLFCHATPRSDTEIFTRLTDENRLLPIFGGLGVTAIVCGHTHMQFDRMVGNVRVVNAGSVGMPFGKSGAYWLLLSAGMELRRTDYDLADAAERIRRTSYPSAEDFASHNVLEPPSEEDTLKAFGAVGIK
jgi:predicted phosphodiesterase